MDREGEKESAVDGRVVDGNLASQPMFVAVVFAPESLSQMWALKAVACSVEVVGTLLRHLLH